MWCRISEGEREMKKIIFVGLLGLVGVVTFSLGWAEEQERRSFCDECGSVISLDFLSLYKPRKEGSRLLCKKCSKKGKGRKDGASSSPSPSPSPFALGSDSVFDSPLSSASMSPITPLPRSLAVGRSASVPLTFVVDENRVVRLAEFIVEEKLRKKAAQQAEFMEQEKVGKWMIAEESYVESYGEPRTFNEAMSVKICALEKLYEASKKPVGSKYTCVFHKLKKYAEVVDPHGSEQTLIVDGDAPFLFKRGGVMVFKGSGALHVKDLETDCSSSFPSDTLSTDFLQQKCEEYGFEKVIPLAPDQEAVLALQRRVEQLPSPHFS